MSTSTSNDIHSSSRVNRRPDFTPSDGKFSWTDSGYWHKTLTDAPVLLNLPTDRPRPLQQSFAEPMSMVQFNIQITDSLKLLNQENDSTQFIILLVAWSAVLSRLSGQVDLVIGIPRTKHNRGVNESMGGSFDDWLPLRVDLSGEPSTIELLDLVRACMQEAQVNADVSNEQIMEIIQPPQKLNHSPLFQVTFVWSVCSTPDIEGISDSLNLEILSFDLELNLQSVGNEIHGYLKFATTLFDTSTIERYINYLNMILHGMMDDPTRSVHTINIIDPSERKLLVETWNETQIQYQEHLCIHQLFEHQVMHTPNATALVYEDQVWSYEELNMRANRLAHQLMSLGIKPDMRIAICVERSPAMVVGLLSILKAGGAYVPLDPAYPSNRLAYILNDAAPMVLLADEVGRSVLNSEAHTLTILDPNLQTTWPTTNPNNLELSSHHLAYVIYTSGSTGNPKGVMVEHRGVINLIQAERSCFEVDSSSRVLQFASLSFDTSVSEIFMALSCGGSLYLPPDIARFDRNGLWSYLAKHSITHVTLTPTMLQDGQDLPILSSPLTLIMGGEALSGTLLRTLIPQGVVINAYGPTETSISAIIWRCSPNFKDELVPIGRPIANTRVYLLDKYGQPVPLGAVGEIYIGGAGITRGYLNLPEMTAERFIPDPFNKKDGARMYKTGDLARYLPDGVLVFLGRNDHQVKIRGIRIEVGEIEARLIEHPQVQEAAVITVGEGNDKRMVAYVVAESAEHLPHILRAYLKTKLPEHLVPINYVCLDELPLSPNGKLDRRALPAIDDKALAREVYEAPEGEIEIALAGIWSVLLQVEHISRKDNFFALGGHSLLAVRLMNRVVDLGAELPLAMIFSSPNLASLATTVEQHLNQKNTGPRAIKAVSRMGALEPSFTQESLWFVSQLNDKASVTYNIPLAMKFRGELDGMAWQQALNTLFARHEVLRSVFHNIDGRPKVELLNPGLGIPIKWHDLRGVPNVRVQIESLTAMEMYSPFDLSQGPLVRARLIQLSGNEYIFLFTIYHLVSDGWSAGLITNELNTLYAAYRAGQPDPLPPLFIQYSDYAAWQKKWLSGERLQDQSAYWQEVLANAPALLELPTDRPRPPQQSFAGAVSKIHLDKQMTLALRRLSQEYGVTLFVILLSAWSAVLSRLSGQDDILIGSMNANRNHHQVEGLIGLFANLLVLRIDLSGKPSVSQLLERVWHCTLNAQNNQDIPFEEVVRVVNPPRKLDHTPIFQVTFTWQNIDMGTWDLPGLEVTSDFSSFNTASFDLELDLQEVDDEIIGELCFATALFDHQTIERYISYLKAMLQAMMNHPKQSIATLDIISPDERKVLLESRNETHMLYQEHMCIHQLFEQQVMRTPNATALVYEGEVWSYEELNTRANRLAHQLISLGIKPDMRIAICVERSPAMVMGLLSILKAGGAYVPLDPTYSTNRLSYMINDAAPMVLIADEAGRSVLSKEALTSVTILDLNTQITFPCTNPTIPDLASSHLGCVIYTSTITGKPKGVMMEHRNITNLIQGQWNYLEVNSSSRVLQLASLSVDMSILEIFIAIGYGAGLYLPPDAVYIDRSMLWNYLATHEITHVALTPSLLQDGKDLPVLRSPLTLITRDQVLSAALLRTLIPQGIVVTLYGPTEISVGAVTWRCPPDFDGELVPIGRPIANTRVYLLDNYGQPVPLGAVGEIYIGGASVTRGYLNLPEMTAECFLFDRFNADEGSQMYKTGDLARYLPDGNLEFVSSRVRQVKIEGMQVEVNEIEACLTKHPQVREATVIPLGDERTSTHHVCEMPQGKIETVLAGIWSDLLHIEHINRHDNFFSLGGDSLLAIMMASQIMTALNIEATVRMVFESPTISGLTQRMLESESSQDDSVNILIPIKPTGTRPPLFCIHALVGHPWSVTDLARYLNKEQSVHYLEARLRSNVTSIDAAFDIMALECVNQILRVQTKGPYYLLGWSYGASIAHRIAVQLELQGMRVELLALLDGYPDYSDPDEKSKSDISFLEKQQSFKYPKPENTVEMSQETTCCSFFNCFNSENIAIAGKYFWEKYRDLLSKASKKVPHRIYKGDLLFVHATEKKDGSAPLLSPDLWKPYVRGNIETYGICCQQEDMIRSEFTSQIAQILGRKLDQLHQAQQD